MVARRQERVSRGELLRRHRERGFVGREPQRSLFAHNLSRNDMEAPFVFYVHGLGGVGKSTLLRQWREAARATGALTALVEGNDVHGVPDVLTELARQLSAAADSPLRKFEEAVKAYRSRQVTVAAGEAGPEPGGDGASLPSRFAVQALVGGAGALIPGGSVVGAMANQEALARGLDRAWGATAGRGRREPQGDVTGLSEAFVAELDRMSEDWPRIVLFFDTWERSGPYLDGWLPRLVENEQVPFPANVIVVLAGRDELSPREWEPLREADAVCDVPLEVFTREETQALLARHGVRDPEVVDAVVRVSGGLPLLVDLLAQTTPESAASMENRGDLVDVVVDRFLQWIEDPHQRETVLVCSLAQELNEDVFTALAPPGGQHLWGWLCGQSFVSGQGDYKQYHAVVRASMLHRMRTNSPQGWRELHERLADAQDVQLATVEEELTTEWAARNGTDAGILPEYAQWADERWRRYRAGRTYHRLCAAPHAALGEVLGDVARAAWRDPAYLRQWIDVLSQAARDSGDPALQAWSDRLLQAAAEEDAALACLTTILTDSPVPRPVRARVLAYRGGLQAEARRDQQAMEDLNQAVLLAPQEDTPLALRGEAHREAGRYDQAITDLTNALNLNPENTWALAQRGEAHREA
ncbi:TPR repeat-containing protein, partial [Streptomyces sp. DfronAA-171]